MSERDVSVIQDSKIALQVINKMTESGRGFNFVYVDCRRSDIDNRQVSCSEKIDESTPLPLTNDSKKILPSVVSSKVGKIPGYLKDDLKKIVVRFPKPILDHVIKALFELAVENGSTDQERGEFLGIDHGKMHYWKKKLNIK